MHEFYVMWYLQRKMHAKLVQAYLLDIFKPLNKKLNFILTFYTNNQKLYIEMGSVF